MAFSWLPRENEQLIDRRRFLGGLSLAGLSLATGAPCLGDDASRTIALVSDTHIQENPETVARNQVPAKNLREVVSRILDLKDKPGGVMIDGDLALKDGQVGDYKTFASLLKPIRDAKLPIHLALGNHDDRGNFRSTLGVEPKTKVVEKHVGVADLAGLRLVLLDSLQRPDFTPGMLGDAQRGWLSETLDAKPEAPTLLFVHHNLDAKSSGALTDTTQLLEIVKTRRQVKGVVFGHTHVWNVRKDDDLYLINIPAVGYPFAASEPIGWTLLTALDDGAELRLSAIGGNVSKNGDVARLKWRSL